MSKNLQSGTKITAKDTVFNTVLKRLCKSMTTPMGENKISITIAVLTMLTNIF